MLIYLLNMSILTVAFIMVKVFQIKRKKKSKAIKVPKHYNDTSEAQYAINERGFLEEIHHDKVSSDAQ
jgi:hypothetical protein